MDARSTNVAPSRGIRHEPVEASGQFRLVRRGGVWAFVASLILVGVFWGGVLPWIGRFPGVRARIQRHEKSGIDPSAMFYTELGILSGVRLRGKGKSWYVEEFQLGK